MSIGKYKLKIQLDDTQFEHGQIEVESWYEVLAEHFRKIDIKYAGNGEYIGELESLIAMSNLLYTIEDIIKAVKEWKLYNGRELEVNYMEDLDVDECLREIYRMEHKKIYLYGMILKEIDGEWVPQNIIIPSASGVEGTKLSENLCLVEISNRTKFAKMLWDFLRTHFKNEEGKELVSTKKEFNRLFTRIGTIKLSGIKMIIDYYEKCGCNMSVLKKFEQEIRQLIDGPSQSISLVIGEIEKIEN